MRSRVGFLTSSSEIFRSSKSKTIAPFSTSTALTPSTPPMNRLSASEH